MHLPGGELDEEECVGPAEQHGVEGEEDGMWRRAVRWLVDDRRVAVIFVGRLLMAIIGGLDLHVPRHEFWHEG